MNFLQAKSGAEYEEILGYRWVRKEYPRGRVGYHLLVRGWKVSVFVYDNGSHYWLRVEEKDIDDLFIFASKDDAVKRLSYLLKDEQIDYDGILSEVQSVRKSSKLINYEKRSDLTYLMYRLIKGTNANELRRGVLAGICAIKDSLDDSEQEEQAMIDGRYSIRTLDKVGIRERLTFK